MAKNVMSNPRVQVIFWGREYRDHPDAVFFTMKMISDLVTGPFMNGLALYGIGRGSVPPPVFIDTPVDSPAPGSQSRSNIGDRLKHWINDQLLVPPPTSGNNQLYFIVPPSTTKLAFAGDDPETNENKGTQGWHDHGRLKDSSTDDDLVWAIVKSIGHDPTKAGQFAKDISAISGHELVEAFSNPFDNNGIISSANRCKNKPTDSDNVEIGDACECRGFVYRGFDVQQYFSLSIGDCIQGSSPVSLRQFLKAINGDGSKGLRALNMPAITTDSIAARVFQH